jgi:hypothetical protein
MNIFLIDSDPYKSAVQLFAKDPLRANKQIVECCQLLAFVEIRLTGKTTLRRKDGNLYSATKAQLNHPISVHMSEHRDNYNLCWNVLGELVKVKPTHACKESFYNYHGVHVTNSIRPSNLIVCRKGYPIVYVTTYVDYSRLMLDYMIHHKWN